MKEEETENEMMINCLVEKKNMKGKILDFFCLIV